MSKRYTGGVVSSAVPTVNAASASGIFTLGQQATAQSNNNWPPFKVEKSLRFRNSASGYLSKTPAVAGNRRTWTLSFWVKRGALGNYSLFGAGVDGNNLMRVLFGNNIITFYDYSSSSYQWLLQTTQEFRDPSAWYHIVCAVDTTQSTSANRVKLYINGTQVTALGSPTYPSQNYESRVNYTYSHFVGASHESPAQYYDGYMSEVYLIDGQALTPSSFGATDKDGNWSPIAYTGTYGQNGFYLNFKDATSTTTLGYDYSGNGNNWTPNNLSVTAGATNDSLQDVPGDQSDGTAYGGRGNYCTMNPLFVALDANFFALSNANLTIAGTSASNSGGSVGTMSSKTGKFYYEFNITSLSAGYCAIGASDVDQLHTLTPFNYLGYGSKSYGYFSSGSKTNNNGTTTYGSSYTTGDVIGVAVDCDNGAIYFSKNNTWQTSGDPTSGATKTGAAYTWTGASQNMIPQMDVYQTGAVMAVNFGQRPFAYTPPSGFKSLNTFNLPEPTIKQPNKHFDINLWTGTGATQSITNSGQFQPDFVWIKGRSNATYHMLTNSVTGSTRYLYSNDILVEGTWTDQLTSFNSNGFTLGADTNGSANYSGRTFVGWQWNAGGANTTNTDGTITSIVRANPTAGFSIATYSGNSLSGQTVGHGLGVSPDMIIVKSRNATNYWIVQHKSLTSITRNVYLNDTATEQNDAQFTAKSSTTVSIHNSGGSTNQSGTNYVMYCWAAIPGYSAFGSYTGNGSTDGTFIYTGFRPRYIMLKCSSNATNWWVYDSSRNTYNAVDLGLVPSQTNADTSGYPLDFLSNGFKFRNSNGDFNGSGRTYIYMAFAEMPFKYSRSR